MEVSGGDADDKIQMSQSVAQQKLQALMSRRSSEQGMAFHLIQPVAVEVGPGLLNSTTALTPLGHPYNLPSAAPPMMPGTTRRRMFKTERRRVCADSCSGNVRLAATPILLSSRGE